MKQHLKVQCKGYKKASQAAITKNGDDILVISRIRLKIKWQQLPSKSDNLGTRYDTDGQHCYVIYHTLQYSVPWKPRPTNQGQSKSRNSLPEYLRDPELSIDTFRHQLQTFLFAQYSRRHSSALETFVPFALYKFIIYITLHLHYG